jgi:GNAT superfamily N-acetyltransferase
MIKKFFIKKASSSDYKIVSLLVEKLLVELEPESAHEVNSEAIKETARNLVGDDGPIWAFAAYADDGKPVGVITLHQCAALYTDGIFGEISEIYVEPEYRSAKVGQALIEQAISFGKEKSWKRLEVGAPDQPRWARSVKFYLDMNFVETGPRLKLHLS